MDALSFLRKKREELQEAVRDHDQELVRLHDRLKKIETDRFVLWRDMSDIDNAINKLLRPESQ